MSDIKKAFDMRNQQWELYWNYRDSTNETPEEEMVKTYIEILNNTLSFLLMDKLVESEWTTILGENGLLNDLEKKAVMASGLGLLNPHHIQLLRQIEEVEKTFEALPPNEKSFEGEPVTLIVNEFRLPENAYLPRMRLDNNVKSYLRWNPLASAKNTRARFVFVMDCLYFDFLNRITFLNTHSPKPIEEVTISMVVEQLEDEYWKFIGDTRLKEGEVALELKISQQTERFMVELDKPALPPTQFEALKKKRKANQKKIESLQKELEQLAVLKEVASESWKAHRRNFNWIVEEIQENELKKPSKNIDINDSPFS